MHDLQWLQKDNEHGLHLVAGGQREEDGDSHDAKDRNKFQSHQAESCNEHTMVMLRPIPFSSAYTNRA